MAGSAFAPTAAALAALAKTTLPPDWTTTLGFNLSQGTGPLMMIGGDDPDDPTEVSLGSAQQDWAYVGGVDRQEEGDVICSARKWTGNNDLPTVVNDIQAVLDTYADALRANPSVGVPQLLWTQFATTVEWFGGIDPEYGPKVRAVFQVHFRAQI